MGRLLIPVFIERAVRNSSNVITKDVTASIGCMHLATIKSSVYVCIHKNILKHALISLL
jgi:hypothetical protein